MSKIVFTEADLTVARRLREYRQMRQYSQDSIAFSLGLTDGQIGKYESGENRITAGRLWEIAKILDVPIERFFMPATVTEDGAGGRAGLRQRS